MDKGDRKRLVIVTDCLSALTFAASAAAEALLVRIDGAVESRKEMSLRTLPRALAIS